MHTYKTGEEGYTVGFELVTGWRPIKTFKSEDQAAEFASFLNGGAKPKFDIEWSPVRA